ncbi:MerR family transcriptional regulator [bacterium]|nr:MerR family transcriptional regulator [bacterium]
MVEKNGETNRNYTANDVRAAANLSYRQLNGWDEKGVLPESRESGKAWRKFTPGQVFVIMVMSEIRRRFGVPLDKLRWLGRQLFERDSDWLREAVHQFALLGSPIFLYTDLKSIVSIDADFEIGTELQLGAFGPAECDGFIMLRLNDLVNRMLRCLKDPIQLEVSDRGRMYMLGETFRSSARSVGEQELLELVRKGRYSRLVVHLDDGDIKKFDAEEELKPEQIETIKEILGERAYQHVVVKQHNGRVDRFVRTLSIRPGERDATERS